MALEAVATPAEQELPAPAMAALTKLTKLADSR